MIPISLRFSGLNSYRTLQNIDFAELTACGLFGIFGITGAGKSTILDAITLALFGEVKRALRQTQGIINSQEQSCFVSFCFTLDGHRYTAERVLTRVKNEPFSSASKSCRLIQDDTLVLADKSSAMDAAVKSLLQMNCERFCQTVILPQGQFDQLLKLKPGERSSMLEELFHFSEYGDALTRRCRSRWKLSEARLTSLEEQLALLGEVDEASLRQLREEIAKGEYLAAELFKNYEAAQRKLHAAEAAAAQAAELESARRDAAKLEGKAEEMEARRLKLQQAEKAEPLRSGLTEVGDIYKKSLAAQEEAARAQKESAEMRAKKESALLLREEAQRSLSQEKENGLPRLERLKQALHEQEQLLREEAGVAAQEKDILESGLKQQVAQAELFLVRYQRDAAENAQALAQAEAEALRCREAWEAAVSAQNEQREALAVTAIAAKLRTGEACPVCGSREHPALAQGEPAGAEAQLAASEQEVRVLRQAWKAAEERCDKAKAQSKDILAAKDAAAASLEKSRQSLTAKTSALETMRQSATEKRARWQALADCEDPAAEITSLEKALSAAEERAKSAEEKINAAQQAAQTAELNAVQKQSMAQALAEQLENYKAQLLSAVYRAGFAEANEAKSALVEENVQKELLDVLSAYDRERQELSSRIERLGKVLADFHPESVAEARDRAKEMRVALAEAQNQQGGRQAALQQAETAQEKSLLLQEEKTKLQSEYNVLKRLANLLKGNAFVRYLAKGSMLELAHEASDILLSLTARRFRLELFEDAGGSNFLIVDYHNGGLRRQVSSLSGGETFLVSLALALALSRKIQMGAAPLGFFFLDEGFGSLDESSLEAALAVLEKLPSDRRAVGVITHVKGVQERIPRYLEVTVDPVQGSQVRLCKN